MKTIYKNYLQPLEDVEWGSASAICLNNKNEICIVLANDKNYWTLVGGGREGDETPEQTIVREIKEEAQADVEDLEYLLNIWAWEVDDNGNKIEERKHSQAYRYICKLKNIQEFIPNKDGHEIIERKFVSLEDLHIYLPWVSDTENGKEFYEMLKSKLETI